MQNAILLWQICLSVRLTNADTMSKRMDIARGVATGVYIPHPNSVTVLITCRTLTYVLKLQRLVKTYTPSRISPQIKFLATPLDIASHFSHDLIEASF